jgi:hypothetical protein
MAQFQQGDSAITFAQMLLVPIVALMAADMALTARGLPMGYEEKNWLAAPVMERFGMLRGMLIYEGVLLLTLGTVVVLFPRSGRFLSLLRLSCWSQLCGTSASSSKACLVARRPCPHRRPDQGGHKHQSPWRRIRALPQRLNARFPHCDISPFRSGLTTTVPCCIGSASVRLIHRLAEP